MPRPRKCRFVQAQPLVTLFKPQGAPAWQLEEVTLSVEGLEVIRLVDWEGLDQEVAAARMGVSRPTLSRILAESRRLVAEALVKGFALRVEGGNFTVGEAPLPEPGPGHWRHGRCGGSGRHGRR